MIVNWVKGDSELLWVEENWNCRSHLNNKSRVFSCSTNWWVNEILMSQNKTFIDKIQKKRSLEKNSQNWSEYSIVLLQTLQHNKKNKNLGILQLKHTQTTIPTIPGSAFSVSWKSPPYFFSWRVIGYFYFVWSVNEDFFFRGLGNLYFSVLVKLVFHFFVIREKCIYLHVICELKTFVGITFHLFGKFSINKAQKLNQTSLHVWHAKGITTATLNQESLKSTLVRCVTRAISKYIFVMIVFVCFAKRE